MGTSTAQDQALGLIIVKKYYEGAKFNFPFAVNYSFDEMLKTLQARTGGKTFVQGLGLAAALAEFDDGDIKESMYSLAKAAGGRIPSKNGDFYAYMVDRGTQVKFVDAVVFTATESAKNVIEGAAAVGDSLISTGKILTFIFPAVVLYFGFIYLQNKTK